MEAWNTPWGLSADALSDARAQGRITKWEEEFYISNLDRDFVTERQAPIKQRIEAKLAGGTKAAAASAEGAEKVERGAVAGVARFPGAGAWELDIDTLKHAFNIRKLNQFEFDFYFNNIGKKMVTEKQAPIKQKIEAKVATMAAGALPGQANGADDWPYDFETVERAWATQKITNWERKFYLENIGRQELSEKQLAVKVKLDKRLALVAQALLQAIPLQDQAIPFRDRQAAAIADDECLSPQQSKEGVVPLARSVVGSVPTASRGESPMQSSLDALPGAGLVSVAPLVDNSIQSLSEKAALEAASTEVRLKAQRELEDARRELEEARKARKEDIEELKASLEKERQAAELEKEAIRRRAERAEAELRIARQSASINAPKKPVPSRRVEFLQKRRRLEHDPRLSAFDGSLHSRINQARDAGDITFHEASTMHHIRMSGNKAAHEPNGFFGTQVAVNLQSDEEWQDSDEEWQNSEEERQYSSV